LALIFEKPTLRSLAQNGTRPQRITSKTALVGLRIVTDHRERVSWRDVPVRRDLRGRLSRHADLAKPIDYMLKRWPAFTRFLDDGRICVSNNAAERALRGIALGRRAWLFAGSDRGGERAAAMYTLIATAKLNGVDPQAWLADVLRRIADHPAAQLHELLPWHWKPRQTRAAAA
jgi:transposase